MLLQFTFRLRERMPSLVMMLPNLPIVPRISQALNEPSDSCHDPQYSAYDVSPREHRDSLNETCRAGRRNTKDHVDGEEEVPAAEEEVEVIVQRLLLHVGIVNRTVPQQERQDPNNRKVRNGRPQILGTVAGSTS